MVVERRGVAVLAGRVGFENPGESGHELGVLNDSHSHSQRRDGKGADMFSSVNRAMIGQTFFLANPVRCSGTVARLKRRYSLSATLASALETPFRASL